MKVTITGKGDAFVEARFDAETNVETLILSTVAPVVVLGGVSIDSPRRYDDSQKQKSHVRFDTFSVPTHELIDRQS